MQIREIYINLLIHTAHHRTSSQPVEDFSHQHYTSLAAFGNSSILFPHLFPPPKKHSTFRSCNKKRLQPQTSGIPKMYGRHPIPTWPASWGSVFWGPSISHISIGASHCIGWFIVAFSELPFHESLIQQISSPKMKSEARNFTLRLGGSFGGFCLL